MTGIDYLNPKITMILVILICAEHENLTFYKLEAWAQTPKTDHQQGILVYNKRTCNNFLPCVSGSNLCHDDVDANNVADRRGLV